MAKISKERSARPASLAKNEGGPNAARVFGVLANKGYSRLEITRIVAPRRTLDRRLGSNEALAAHEADRVERLARTHDHAVRVFGSADKANRWLRKPSRTLDGETPIKLLETETGAYRVAEALHAIDHGVFM